MVIVVNLPMVMPASKRPEIEDPMTASFADAAVAGPYMYFTVARPCVETI